MISSFYHPQNEYCVAVSGSAKPHFKVVLRQLASCFSNIHVMVRALFKKTTFSKERPPITWGSFEIINSTYSCMEYLSSLESKWEYFQVISLFSLILSLFLTVSLRGRCPYSNKSGNGRDFQSFQRNC